MTSTDVVTVPRAYRFYNADILTLEEAENDLRAGRYPDVEDIARIYSMADAWGQLPQMRGNVQKMLEELRDRASSLLRNFI